jgi:hypothetical protein
MHYTSTLFFCNIQCCLMQGEPGTRKSIGCRRHAVLAAHNGTSARYESPTFIQLDLVSLRLPSRKRKRLQQDFCRKMALVRRECTPRRPVPKPKSSGTRDGSSGRVEVARTGPLLFPGY